MSTSPDATRVVAHELELTRVFDAPREVVFDAWTRPEAFARWFGPRGTTLPTCRLDPRPGGLLHFCHRHAEGPEVWIKGAYREVVRPERLVFVTSFVDEHGTLAAHPAIPDLPIDAAIVTTVTFAEHRGGTRLTVHQATMTTAPPTDAVRATLARERELASQGWRETLDRLAEVTARGDRGREARR